MPVKRQREDTPDAIDDPKRDEVNDYNRPFRNDDADCTIVSADGLHFKVHKYQLMADRVMLANAEAGAAGSVIHLTDSALETAKLVSIMFTLTYGLNIPSWGERSLSNAVQLLRKYDCRRSLNAAGHIVRSKIAIGNSASQLELFITAAHLNDYAACAEAIRRRSKISWTASISKEASDHDVSSAVKDSSIFDPSGMSVDVLQRLPGPYLVALVRAHAHALETSGRKLDWHVVARESVSHMEVHNKRSC